MSTASEVPETRDLELEGDEARETLRNLGVATLLKRAALRFRYADGFSRQNSNRGSMIINGRRVPVVGRVCMDQTMIDLGPSSEDRVGDDVVCLGGQGTEFISTDEVADLMGTITYEVTCLIAGRVHRRYVE